MNFENWLDTIPDEITSDSLWRMKVYRLALFAADVSWQDAKKLREVARQFSLSNQLYRAVGPISANIAEGYSRSTGKDRARFYEYALGSARESRDWYFKSRHDLGDAITTHRIDLLAQTTKLLITMIPKERNTGIREDAEEYEISGHGGNI